MQVWRLVKSKYAATAFDGEGPRLYGARWNSIGTRVAYGSENPSLAVLEVLAHLEKSKVLPAYSMVTAAIPDELVDEIDPALLPGNWQSYPAPTEVQAIGDAWIQSGGSLALRVPSVLLPEATNLLINPAHPKFNRVVIERPTVFFLDSRLTR